MLTLTWGTDILFDKLRPETGGMNLNTPFAPCLLPWGGFHANPVFFLNIFSGYLHVDGFFIGLY